MKWEKGTNDDSQHFYLNHSKDSGAIYSDGDDTVLANSKLHQAWPPKEDTPLHAVWLHLLCSSDCLGSLLDFLYTSFPVTSISIPYVDMSIPYPLTSAYVAFFSLEYSWRICKSVLLHLNLNSRDCPWTPSFKEEVEHNYLNTDFLCLLLCVYNYRIINLF